MKQGAKMNGKLEHAPKSANAKVTRAEKELAVAKAKARTAKAAFKKARKELKRAKKTAKLARKEAKLTKPAKKAPKRSPRPKLNRHRLAPRASKPENPVGL